MLAEGQVAVTMIYLGEEQVVGSDSKGEIREPAISCDLWGALSRMFPHKVGWCGCGCRCWGFG